ncbi:hypothetical protein GCM10009815_11250 [Nocardioides marmoribigeumensis]
MGWGHMSTSVQRRAVMREIVRAAQETGDVVAPWTAVDDVETHFADDEEVLLEVHREWVRVLVARLHRGEIVAERTAVDVRDLYDEVAASHPTLRRILDTHDTHPVLWEPTAQEHALLARIAGLAPAGTLPERASTIGRTLVSQRIPRQRVTV